jgi:hypothetical protein
MGKPKNRRGRRQGKNSNGPRSANLQSQSMVTYSGPARLTTVPSEPAIVVRLAYVAQGNTGTTGILSLSATNNPTPTTDFSEFAVNYLEYRTLVVTANWRPRDAGFSSLSVPNVQNPAVQWVSRTSPIGIPSSQQAAWDNDSAVVRNIGQGFRCTWRMNGTPDADWKQCGIPVSNGGVGIYSDGLTPSAYYGNLFIEMLVQFRNRI